MKRTREGGQAWRGGLEGPWAPALGFGVWLVLLASRWQAGVLDEFLLAETLFLLAPLVIVPLGLPLTLGPVRPGGWSRLRTLLGLLQPVGALALLAAFTLEPPGQARLALGLPYLLLALCTALHACGRLLERGVWPVEELAHDAALLCPLGGAVWLLTWMGDFALLGFQGLWVLLTAIHFHFAGFGCLLIAGGVGRLLRAGRLKAVVALGLMAAFPLLAAGIAGQRALEVLGVLFYVLLLPLLAGLLLRTAALLGPGRRVRWLFVGAAFAVLVSTTLAGLWGLPRPSPVELPTMIRLHGSLNALGFVGLGLLGLRLLPSSVPETSR